MLSKKDKKLHIDALVRFVKEAQGQHMDEMTMEEAIKYYYNIISQQFGKDKWPYDTGFTFDEVMDYYGKAYV